LLSRRRFNGFCAALSASVRATTAAIATLSPTPAVAEATRTPSTTSGHTVRFLDATVVPALGQGSARLGQGGHPETAEEEALRTGLSLGMTLVDTAEIYGNGNAERLIGHVIAGQRDRVFLVSKVWPSHVAGDGIEQACDASLSRLRTHHLDLYLLHWPSGITDFSTVVTAFEKLATAGRFAHGESPTSMSVTWKPFSMSLMAIAARPTRPFTTSPTAELRVTCFPGASSTRCP
jgi:Aldo/keto reductase family